MNKMNKELNGMNLEGVEEEQSKNWSLWSLSQRGYKERCDFCENDALLYKERKKTFHCEQH